MSAVTYVVVRSGQADAGRWLTETRNVYDDYKQIYGEEPPEEIRLLSLAVDSNDTRSTAESSTQSPHRPSRHSRMPLPPWGGKSRMTQPGSSLSRRSDMRCRIRSPVPRAGRAWRGCHALGAADVGRWHSSPAWQLRPSRCSRS